MTQLSRQSFLLIEDSVDAVGQRHRVQRIVRGAMLFVAAVAVGVVLASLAAHGLGAGWGARVALGGFIVGMLAAGGMWILRPLLIRPKAVAVARMIESRVDGLHNGLTNALLLADRDDLRDSPWLGSIFDEILLRTRGADLDSAVKLTDLRRLAGWCGVAVAGSILVGVLLKSQVAHGWEQMFAPTAFVPIQGDMVIDSLEPGDVTLIAGQPLELSATAHGPTAPLARLMFDPGRAPVELTPAIQTDGSLRYGYRLEHVDATLRYRLEVGRTQSPWHTATVVQQVKATDLTVTITPPAYTKQAATTVTVDLDPGKRTALRVAQGGKVALGLGIDVAVQGAMLQLNADSPATMEATGDGRHFTGAAVVSADASASVLLTQGGGQIIAKLPDPALAIAVIADAPPTIELKWPTQDVSIPPTQKLSIKASCKDDYGLTHVRVLTAYGEDQPLATAMESDLTGEPAGHELAIDLPIPAEQGVHGKSVRVQVQVSDNRRLGDSMADGGPQTTSSKVVAVRFRDPAQLAREEKEQGDKLREILQKMLKDQQGLLAKSVAYKLDDASAPGVIGRGQTDLRDGMVKTAQTFEFTPEDRTIQKTLLVLAYGPAREAIDLCAAMPAELVAAQRTKINQQVMDRQRRIVTVLESLLALLNTSARPTTEPTGAKGDMPNEREQLQKLSDDLKTFVTEQRKILDQTASLAKKPVDNWDDADRKLLDELTMAQEKLDSFMQQKVSDYSKLAEQDMANATLLKELLEVYSEVTMAKGALKDQAVEIAVSLEESGVELAQELSSNLEKWLMDKPDRQKWTMEDPVGKFETPMSELPTELEDMIGELMEQEEDLFDEMEDTNANWTDSLDKGAGWDAADGPIANMSAKGVTGNQLPNNNEMGGRAGEGRSGKSQGEMVEDTASGKGGRKTPTRLDPTAFQQGQINDTSTDPVGGATGGGKISGQGGEGLEGPVPPGKQQAMKRLARKQAQIRNSAERIQMQYRLGRYDNFQLMKAIAMMRRVEADLSANRYQNALRRRDVLLDDMGAGQSLAGGEVHVQRDSTPSPTGRIDQSIHAVTGGELPAAWSGVLETYYRKLAAE